MNPLLLGSIFEMGKTLLDRFVPDPEKRAAAEFELIKMASEGDLKKVMMQLEINAKEAVHPSIWVSGWRPFFGWSSGGGFVYATILQPLLAWYSLIKGYPTPPELNIDLLWVVITGLLGIAGARSFEKSKGVTK
jgi:hypothetical protein